MTAPPAWWSRLPRPPGADVPALPRGTVYQLAALRRERRRLELLAPHLGRGAARADAAVRELLAAEAELLADLE